VNLKSVLIIMFQFSAIFNSLSSKSVKELQGCLQNLNSANKGGN
jgi:hypothetical protein